jgi:hypothetical protein
MHQKSARYRALLAIALLVPMVAHGSCTTNSCSTDSSCSTSTHYGKTWFSQRDQSAHEYVVMAMTADKRHQFDRNDWYGDFAVTLGWQQNFKRNKLSSYFLNQKGSMVVGADNIAGVDVRASDLGLASDHEGTARLCPKYQDFIADFDLYVGWDKVLPGMWSEVRFPLVHTRWNARLNIANEKPGTETFYKAEQADPGDEAKYAVADSDKPVEIVYKNLADALKGDKVFGDATKLGAGKIDACTRTETGLAGIHLTLGYDFLRRERGNMGLALHVGFPAANKPKKNTCACDSYLFKPKIGSQHAWKVGGVLRGQYMLWNRDEEKHFDIYVDGRVDAVFRGDTTRTIGFKAKKETLFNNYLLEKKFLIEGESASYKGLDRAALKARVRAQKLAEGQATIMFQYTTGNFNGSIGYNFFGRGKECLKLCNYCFDTNFTFVIKGTAPIKRINDGTKEGGYYSKQDSDIKSTGTVIDQGADAVSVANLKNATFTTNDLDLQIAAHPRYISHTIFAHLGYNWSNTNWQPYLGVLGKVEFGSKNTALNVWGVYLKGGVSF